MFYRITKQKNTITGIENFCDNQQNLFKELTREDGGKKQFSITHLLNF